MTILALYPTKKELKAAVRKSLKYRETSMFGAEYTPNGTFLVHLTRMGRGFFVKVTMRDGIILEVT